MNETDIETTNRDKYAVIIETTSDEMQRDGVTHQAILVRDPNSSDLIIKERTTNGKRGRGNAWGHMPEHMLHAAFGRDEEFTTNPISLVLTESETESLKEDRWSRGLALSLTGRLNQAKDRGDEVTAGPVYPALAVFTAALREEEDLSDYLPTNERKPKAEKEDKVEVEEPKVEEEKEDTSELAKLNADNPLVPDFSEHERYVQRQLKGGVSDYAMLDHALAKRKNILLLGPTGSGKTTLPIAWAAFKRAQFYSVSGNIAMEPSQLFGKFVPTEEAGVFEWVDGPVTRLVRDGGVLNLDEVNLISPKVLTVLYPLLDARREITLLDHEGETIRAHENLLIVASGNPGYQGTGRMSEAFNDRFSLRWTWDYDPDVEKKLVKSASLRDLATRIRQDGGIDTPVSPRLLMDFEEMVDDLGWDFALENMLNRFSDTEERSSVSQMMVTVQTNIKRDLGLEKPEEKKTPSNVANSTWNRSGVTNWV